MNDEKVVEMTVAIAQTACQFEDQVDLLEVLHNFVMDMAEKHRRLMEQEQRDDAAVKQLLDY